MMMRYLLLIALLCGTQTLLATHNRTGYIRYEQTGPLTVKAEIITYTRASSLPADRDRLTFNWGDNTVEELLRANDGGQNLEEDFQYNIYSGTHTYASAGEYILSMTDPNRNSGILNINPPNSQQIPFHLQATIKLVDTNGGLNKSPTILSPPLDLIYSGQLFTYNPNLFDVDGDSTAYELITPLQGINEPVPNYFQPNEIGPSGNSMFSLNELTGDLVWDTPEIVGIYNIAIRIKSYRNEELIDQFVLDMELTVLAGPPLTRTEEAEWARQHIQLYPNPTVHETMMVGMEAWEKPLRYQIINPAGMRFRSGYLTGSVTEIEVNDFPAGTYFIQIEYIGHRWAAKAFTRLE